MIRSLLSVNTDLTAAIEWRVLLHQDRAADRVSVADYKDGLQEIREIEDELEPRRSEFGCNVSRAYEMATGRTELLA